MVERHLHIISFNVPYPADYGGVIDVFYRIKALKEAGVKIHLHCFRYGREESAVLDGLCDEVVYYRRSMSVFNQLSLEPFIVRSRASRGLLRNLLKDDYPILFEGLHSCHFLGHRKLSSRKKIVRCHNIEHHYYSSLTRGLHSVTLGAYFKLEAFKLRRFEKVLQHADHIAAISEADANYFQEHYGHTFLMKPGHPSSEVNIIPGRGEYVLYHGDLSTRENIDSVRFILEEIASRIPNPIIIAGKNPSAALSEQASHYKTVRLISNPTHNDMQELVSKAHINLLPTFQATGFKLKLLNALYNGRFCLVSPQMVKGTGLDDACEVVCDASGYCHRIEELSSIEFSTVLIAKRTALLEGFSNNAVISDLLKLI